MKVVKMLKSKNENTQTLFNFLSTTLRTGIVFFTMPLFTRMLGAEQYGLYSIYTSWLLIIECFMGFRLASSLGTALYKFKDDFYSYRSSVLLEGTIICCIVSAVMLLFYKQINVFFHYDLFLYIILIVESIAQFFLTYATGTWIYEKKADKNMIVSVLTLLLGTLLSIVLISNWNTSKEILYYARVIGSAIPEIVIAVIIWFLLFFKKPSGFNAEYWRYGLSFGIPMIFHVLSQKILAQSDRLMMSYFGVSNADIGIYSFFYTYTMVLNTILGALNNSWTPFLYDDLTAENYERLNSKINHYSALFSCLCCGFLMVSREITHIFANEEYWGGMDLIPLLVGVVYTIFIYQFAVNYEFFNAKPKIIAIGTTVAAATNIVLNAIFIPPYGMWGATLATLLSYIVLAILHIIVVKKWKLKRYPLTYKPVFFHIFSIIVCSVLFFALKQAILVRWIIGATIGAYLIITVYRRRSIF